ncbi:MAG TPA: cyclase family protein [Candidatus Binatia bacterium]
MLAFRSRSFPVEATTIAVVFALFAGATARADSFDPAHARLVDLTHPFGPSTVYWPTTPSGFGYAFLSNGKQPGGWYYAAGAFQAPEHGGTHMDAPSHFKEGGTTADQVALSHLIAPVVVLDVTSAVAADPDYEITPIDVMSYETRYGPIPRGAIALAYTGWSKRWPDKKEYLGDDTPGEADNLHFPGFGAEAAKMLVEVRGVAAIGLDTASMDPGKSQEFPVHQLTAAAGVPGFENLTNLDQVPARGAWLLALPMKIEGGTGGPLRAVAMIPEGK